VKTFYENEKKISGAQVFNRCFVCLLLFFLFFINLVFGFVLFFVLYFFYLFFLCILLIRVSVVFESGDFFGRF